MDRRNLRKLIESEEAYDTTRQSKSRSQEKRERQF